MKTFKNFKMFELKAEEDAKTKDKDKDRKLQVLEKFGKDMTKMAEDGELEPVIGRENEIFQVLWVLSRKMKNNPVIIGEAGVGKTAIVEGIAQRLVDGDCPDILKDMRIYYINMGSLLSGASAGGQLEARIEQLLKELEENKDIILFIDEIHLIVNPNASIDVANMFKPALARGKMRLIGATTYNEFRNSIEKDSALDRRFQKVVIKEPNEEETINILNQIKPKYEEYHNVKYTDDAIEYCVKLSGRYITDRFFPDKAIDLLDEVGAKVRLSNSKKNEALVKAEKELLAIKKRKVEALKNNQFDEAGAIRKEETDKLSEIDKLTSESKAPAIEINSDEVSNIVSLKTGIPVKKLTQDEGEKLLGMEGELKLMVIGQDEAVTKISKFVRRSRVGLKDKNRPSGVFLFLGSTGTGKCHGRGTKIMMFDGSVKNVEDVKVGEYLMGDDSTPRKVISLANGHDKMYNIKYKTGSFTCNSEHVLSLKKTGSYEIFNIPLNEYLEKSNHFKHIYKLWNTGVYFEKREVKVDPYFLGLWIGDGDKDRVGITTADIEILNYIEDIAVKNNLKLNKRELKNNKSNTYYLTGENWTNNKNMLLDNFRSYGLINKDDNYRKFIPSDYIFNSSEIRKSLLAGLIDSDGYYCDNCYFISTKYKELANQIVYLCKSLGYMANISIKKVNKYPDNEYYSVNISGSFEDLNVLLDRKKGNIRKQKKSVNLYSFNVEYLGTDEYFGFELDGNRLYLLGDFTVTHNTHTVKMLAKYIFGSESDLIRIDMSEYREKHTVSRLLGSPPGYVGYNEAGQLTEKIRRKPYSILLLDEIEKAHPDVLNVFLQVFDDGHLTDAQGRKVDFKNTIIIMTSNVGAAAASSARTPVGFGDKKSVVEENKKSIIKAALYKYFAPEFINRIDEIIFFNPLEKESVYKIIDIEIEKLSKKLKDMNPNYSLTITNNVKDFLMDVGYDQSMGARPLKRAIQSYIEDPISDEILKKKIKDKIEIDYNKEEKKLVINGELITERKRIKNWRQFKRLF